MMSNMNAHDRSSMQGEVRSQMQHHDTLLDMQEQYARMNKESLRNARNLQDLVNIKVHAVDKQLGT